MSLRKLFQDGFRILKVFGYIKVEIIRNSNNEVIERRIYLADTYCSKDQYPYCRKNQYPIDQKVKDNNINIKIDRLYYCVINNQLEFYDDFNCNEKEKFINIIEKLEFNYNQEHICYFTSDNENKVKIIIYFLADIVKQGKTIITDSATRAELIFIYDKCKLKEKEYANTNKEIKNFYDYYYKSMITELLKK